MNEERLRVAHARMNNDEIAVAQDIIFALSLRKEMKTRIALFSHRLKTIGERSGRSSCDLVEAMKSVNAR